MDLKQIKTFVKVAETGSLSRAADYLRLAQPALSRQIKMLEAEIGIELFLRHDRGMHLTQAGQELLTRVSGLLHQLEKSIDDVRSLKATPSGRVAFGLVPTASYMLASQLAIRVATELAGISLRIVEGYTAHMIDWLHRGEVDAAILYGPSIDLHLRSIDLFSEELVLVGPSHSDLTLSSPFEVSRLREINLVLPSRPHGLRTIVENAAEKAKIPLQVKFEADSFRVLKDLVKAGLGYTVLPISAIFREENLGIYKIAPLVKPRVRRQMILALPVGRTDSRATKAVVDLVLDEIKSLASKGDWSARLSDSSKL